MPQQPGPFSTFFPIVPASHFVPVGPLRLLNRPSGGPRTVFGPTAPSSAGQLALRRHAGCPGQIAAPDVRCSSPVPGSAPWCSRTPVSPSETDAPPWPSPMPCSSLPTPPDYRGPVSGVSPDASPPAIPPHSPGSPPACEPLGTQRRTTPASLPRAAGGAPRSTSCVLAAVVLRLCTIPVSESTPMCAFIPKCHWFPFFV